MASTSAGDLVGRFSPTSACASSDRVALAVPAIRTIFAITILLIGVTAGWLYFEKQQDTSEAISNLDRRLNEIQSRAERGESF